MQKWRDAVGRIRPLNKREIVPEDVFLDIMAKRQEAQTSASRDRKIEVPLRKSGLFYLYLATMAFLIAFLAYAGWMQTASRDVYAQLSLKNRESISVIQPLRGIVYDSNGTPLVRNLTSFDIVLDKRDFSRDVAGQRTILEYLAQLLETDPGELETTIIESDQTLVVMAENITHEQLLAFEESTDVFEGFSLRESVVREYIEHESLSHVLGYMGKLSEEEFEIYDGYSIADSIGKQGIERSYEGVLRGNPGYVQVVRNVQGEQVEENVLAKSTNGNSLRLWLDADLQEVAAESLDASLDRLGADRGAVVVMDVQTGGVLSMVSAPYFDANLFGAARDTEGLQQLFSNVNQPLFNRVVSGQYPTGSTIKPFVATAALEENIISQYGLVDASAGFIEVPHQYDEDIVFRYNDWKKHGIVDMREALAVSSNVYFYTIGGGFEQQEGLGASRIKEYLSLFGWGSATGIDVPGEAAGFLPDAAWKLAELGEAWFVGNTYHFAIGQGYLRATPLQLAASTAAIANGGQLPRPQLVKEVLDSHGAVLQSFQPEVTNQTIADSANLEVIREGMRQAVTSGSSTLLSDVPVRAAAKTGTAQTASDELFHHWVTVFAPYENPEIVVTILVEDVEGLQSATLPIARDILNWYFAE